MTHRHLLASSLLSLFLFGCGGTLPPRTGYDRGIGAYKPAPGAARKNAQAAKATAATPPAATPPASTPPPAASTKADSTTKSDEPANGEVFRGEASYYGKELAGRPTASGEIFDPDLLTCAHRTLPFQTRLRVRYPKKGTSVDVRVNDRGPHKPQRIIDLSRQAADDLGLTADGIGQVEFEILR